MNQSAPVQLPLQPPMPPAPEPMPIAVRAYAQPVEPPAKPTRPVRQAKRAGPQPLPPSDEVLLFDAETLTDPSLQLRVSPYQLRHIGVLVEQGFFYDPLTLSDAERPTLYAYAAEHGREVRTVGEWVEEVFFPALLDRGALCVGFNLPFDLSRLAIGHDSARGDMRGGFSFQLSQDRRRPRLQIRHLNSHTALIRFTAPPRQPTPRGMRKQGLRAPTVRGHFVDVKTLAAARTGSSSWSLGSLADHLQTEHRKEETEEHGGELTPKYLHCAEQDVQVTWECFEILQRRYATYDLTATSITKIYSEASIGKAYLRQMGITPWHKLQPDFPPALLGIIMSTYYGGRSEVHLRRVISRVFYCDFLSMYSTVCTLMGLWDFVIAKRLGWQDATAETEELLANVTLA